jgi:hypothetical protein
MMLEAENSAEISVSVYDHTWSHNPRYRHLNTGERNIIYQLLTAFKFKEVKDMDLHPV